MKLNRRQFLQAASAALILGSMNPNKLLYATESGGADAVLGESLRRVYRHTTLHRTLAPFLANGSLRSQLTSGNGEDLVVRNELMGNKNTNPARNPKSLLFFGQLTDAHLLDEESPARVVAGEEYLELIGVRSAFRPQEDLGIWAIDSMIRTLSKIAEEKPFDFLLNTGDSVDNANELELEWFLTMMEGGYVDPDSGADEDPVPGPNNDANDPFTTPGFLAGVPVYACIGNHDVLFQGNVPVELRDLYNELAGGLLDFMLIANPVGDHSNAIVKPSGKPLDLWDIKAGKIVADARRKPMQGKDFVHKYLSFNAHRSILGFPKSLVGREYAYYTVYPKKDLPIKMIVLDSTSRIGFSEGLMEEEQIKNFLIPELEKSKAAQELVMIVSHHPADDMYTLDEARQTITKKFGRNDKLSKLTRELVSHMESPKNFVSRAEFKEILKSYSNVFLHVAGHKHNNTITPMGEPEKGNGYWEVQTSSLIDFPQQSRVFEIVYEGNGVGAIQTCVVDHNSPKESLACRCRDIAYQDSQDEVTAAIDFPGNHCGNIADRNAILRFPIAPEIAKKLE